MNPHHSGILQQIKDQSGQPTEHTFLDSYLGTSNPRYPINAPRMRAIGKEWIRQHKDLTAAEFAKLLTSLVKGKSSTEKVIAGILLDCSTRNQRKFDPTLFEEWLDHLTGWAEVDSVCTGKYCLTEIPADIPAWKGILTRLSKSKNINKRRASLVFLSTPISHSADPRLATIAFANINRLKKEKEVIITRAISWLLRSMVRHHRQALSSFLKKNEATLPAVAVRETKIKLKTGKKSG
jgi:3-methyladenine DNA glycosylase AlkD